MALSSTKERAARSLHEASRAARGRLRRLGALLLCSLPLAPAALAWGPQGHRTVGAIADRLLAPQTQVVVAQLLAQDADKFGNPSGRTTLEAVSVWADEITPTPAGHARWHYDNEPVCAVSAAARPCRDGECGSVQLKRLIAVMSDPRAPRRARNEALKWVVHLVGDLHQPLHAADNGDRGGNLVQVALAGVRTRGRESLHRAWDNDLARIGLDARNRQRVPPELAALVSEAQTLLGEAGQGSVDSWVRESNSLARNVAYRYAGFDCRGPPAGIVVLDRQYVADGAALARERLLLAGARLAGLLNQTLGGR